MIFISRQWAHGSSLWKFAVVLCLLVIAFPGDYQAIRTGLDPSWVYALNVLPHTEFTSGRDFVHTFGPLGFLLLPLNIGSNLLFATAFRLVIHLLFAACVLWFASRAKNAVPVLAFAVGYTLSMVVVITLEFSYHLLVVELLMFSVSLTDKRLWWIAAPLCSVLAALLLFIKFGIGVAAAAILGPAVVVWILTKQHAPWKILAVVIGFYLATIGLLAAIYLDSVRDFVVWIGRSLLMSNEFSVAQSIVGSRLFLALALFSIAVYAWLVFSLQRQNSRLRYVAPVVALALFLAFKHGFVRVYGHERNFFPFLLASISVLALGMTTKRECRTLLISYVLVLAASLPVGISYALKFGLPPAYETLLGMRGYSNLVSTVRLDETRRRLDLEGAKNLAVSPLPMEWVEKIKVPGASVDVIPWELSYILANQLRWGPNVTLQLFNSYSPVFDQWNADHFAGADSPDFVIVEFLAIDGRHLLLDTPAVTRSILNNYKLDRIANGRNLALLRKRNPPLRDDLSAMGSREIRLDEWIDVPSSSEFLFGDVDISLSLFGQATKFFFRIPPVFLEVVHETGREESYRITPGVAKDGLLINYLPAGQAEFFDLLKGCAKDRVVRFRISGPGTRFYEQVADLRWERGNSPSQLQERACQA